MSRPVAWLAALLGVWAVAVLQPVLAPLAGSPEFFVAHRADALDILILVGVLTLAVPLTLWAVSLACLRAGSSIATTVAATSVGFLAAPAVLQMAYAAGVTGWPVSIAIAILTAVAAAVAWHRLSVIRSFAALLAPAGVIVPALFLLTPAIRPLLWSAAGAEPPARAASPAPVVVVVFDELSLTSLLGPDGMLDAARYPHLAALARDGAWYRHATTVSDYTQWAVPAIMTGRYPRPETAPTARDHPDSIFTALAADFRFEVQEPVTSVCPSRLCGEGTDTRWARLASELGDVRVVASYVFLPPVARQWLPSLTQGWANFDAPSPAPDDEEAAAADVAAGDAVGFERIRRVRAFVDGISSADAQPTLYFLHTLVSHHPARWLPSGQVIAAREEVPAPLEHGRWADDPWTVAAHFQGHLLQAGLADTVVGWLVDRLTQAGLYDRAMIVVVADHGASFHPGDGMRDLTDTNAGDIVPVPLIVKRPGSRNARVLDDRPAQTIDVLPTVADAIGLRLPFPVDGRSLLAPAAGPGEARVYRAKATRVVTYSTDALAALQRAALDGQRALFAEGRWPALRVPGAPDLVGRHVPELEPSANDTGWDVRLSRPFVLEDVDPSGPALPAQVTGTLIPAERAGAVMPYVAIAVNGEIVAVTRPGVGTTQWFALVPPSRFVRGPNRLEAFLVDGARPDRLCRSGAAPVPIASSLNLIQEQARAAGVWQSGLYGTESGRGGSFRWTNGHAVVDVPVDPSHPPRTLELSVRFTGRKATDLQVLIDGCQALSDRIPSQRWSRTIPLDRCPPKGYWAEIEIDSDRHTPSGADTRTLGVALERLALN